MPAVSAPDTELLWFEIALDGPAEATEAVTALRAVRGWPGTEIREPWPAGGAAGSAAVVVYFRAPTPEAARAEADVLAGDLREAGVTGAAIALLDEKVWTENWRHHFPPLRIGARLEVLPPWEEPSGEPGRETIVINPGLAFGTGQHETTLGCLQMLERLVGPGMRVADVGCGSGILAIACARLGAAQVQATDIDPQAVLATVENCQANDVTVQVEAAVAGADGSPWKDGNWDLVLANILAETLVELCAPLQATVAASGLLVLSGIERSRLPLVEEAFIAPGWQLRERLLLGEWATLCLARDNA